MLSRVRRRKIALPDSAIEIALLDWGGEGPLALLHHANGFCAGVWGLVAERLSEHYRVIAMDARGHGDSSKPEGADCYLWDVFWRDVVGVAEVLAAEHPHGRVALGLGHSFGGTAMLMASAERPDLFERNVLVDPVVLPPHSEREPGAVDRAGQKLAEGARKRRQVWPSREAARAKWLEKELFGKWDPRALDLYVAEGLVDRPDGQVQLKCSGETEAAIFEGTGASDLWSSADRVKTPTLIERAARGVFPRAIFERLAARMADAQVCDIDSGHLAPMQHPDRVVAPHSGIRLPRRLKNCKASTNSVRAVWINGEAWSSKGLADVTPRMARPPRGAVDFRLQSAWLVAGLELGDPGRAALNFAA